MSHRLMAVMAALAVVVAVPTAGAVAKSSSRAKVLRATLAPTQPYSTLTGSSKGTITKKNASFSLKVRGATAGTVFTWEIQKDAAATEECGDGVAVSGLKYRKLVANDSGNANSGAKAKKMSLDREATYEVVVKQGDTVVLCGTYSVKTKKAKKPKKAKKH
jgi:hypothetical protein